MPQNSRLKQEGWHQLMMALGLNENKDTYKTLIEAYCEKHRAYHTLEHIDACFWHFDAMREQAQYPQEIELALWFHDAVYKPLSTTNEDDSARLAKEFLSRNCAQPDVIERIHALIILTKDHGQPQTMDGKLMLDIDLSILGAQPHIYAQFEKNVRQEYKRVPSFIFKKKRKLILKAFLGRPRLYHTAYFYDELEVQAKANLEWGVRNL